MADVNTPAADSSPAPQAAPMEVPTESAAYAEWRISGKLPEAPKKQPKSGVSATSNGNSSAASEEAAEKASPASEAGENQQQEKRSRSNAETRLNEILADLRRAGMTPAELKSFKREALKESEQPKAAPEKTDKPAGLQAPQKPKSDDFKTWEEYEAARDEYFENMADYKAAKKLEEFHANQAQQAQAKELKAKIDDAKQRYGDEAEATIRETAQSLWSDQQIHPAVKDLLGGSDVLVDVLYVMGSKPEDLEEFTAMARSNPAAAVRKFVLLEHLVQQELRGKSGDSEGATAPGRDESGRFTKPSPPAKPVTSAPPPPREASGRSAAPPDQVDRALKDGDFAGFRDARNRADIERRRGR